MCRRACNCISITFMSLFRVKARWSGFTGSPGWSVFHFDAPDDAAGPTAQACADAVRSLAYTWRTHIPSIVTINVESSVERIDTPTGQMIDITDVTAPLAVTGTATGNFSAASGACIQWITAGVRNGRRVRGRTFVVPMAATGYDAAGTLSTGALSDLQGGATAFANDFAGAVVYGRPTAPGASDGVAYDIASGRVVDKVAVLRSRRD